MRASLLLAVFGCTGMRPAVARVGPDLADALTLWNAKPPPVSYLGDGCYRARESSIYACSIDVLPAGQPTCQLEPPDGVQVVELLEDWPSDAGWVRAGRSSDTQRLVAFVDELNQHRCHRRWYDTFVVPPPAIEIRDIPDPRRFAPFAELGLQVAPVTLDRSTIVDVCRYRIHSDRITMRVCRQQSGAVTVERTDYNFDSSKEGLRGALVDAVASATSANPAPGARLCSQIEVVARDITCRR